MRTKVIKFYCVNDVPVRLVPMFVEERCNPSLPRKENLHVASLHAGNLFKKCEKKQAPYIEVLDRIWNQRTISCKKSPTTCKSLQKLSSIIQVPAKTKNRMLLFPAGPSVELISFYNFSLFTEYFFSNNKKFTTQWKKLFIGKWIVIEETSRKNWKNHIFLN